MRNERIVGVAKYANATTCTFMNPILQTIPLPMLMYHYCIVYWVHCKVHCDDNSKLNLFIGSTSHMQIANWKRHLFLPEADLPPPSNRNFIV